MLEVVSVVKYRNKNMNLAFRSQFKALILGSILVTATFGSAFGSVICNAESENTNLRSGPSAKNFDVVDTLRNGDEVRILDWVVNPDGYTYYQVRFNSPKNKDIRTAYVYEESVGRNWCDPDIIKDNTCENYAGDKFYIGDKCFRKNSLIVDLRDNSIATIKDPNVLKKFDRVEELSLSKTDIIDLTPIAGIKSLEKLHLSDTRVTDLSPIAGLTNLKTLTFFNTTVENIDVVKRLPHLTFLNFSKTNVKNLEALRDHPSLKHVHLGDTKVTDISPLSTVKTLKSVDIYNTEINDVSPLFNLPLLETLRITQNGENIVVDGKDKVYDPARLPDFCHLFC